MKRVNIKPLSINCAFQGRRFRTPAYKNYERDLMYLLPKIKLPPPPYEIHYVFGFSSLASDFDNCIKTTTDCLAKKYGFNDKLIRRAVIEIEMTKKGKEFFDFNIQTLEIKKT